MAAAVRRQLDKEFTLYIYDVYKPSCERLQKQLGDFGAISIAGSPREVATKCEVVVSMVPGPKEVIQVFLDETNGIMSAPKNTQRLLLESSTIDRETAQRVAGIVRDAGRGVYVDAPVSVCNVSQARRWAAFLASSIANVFV
jgi:3-hydroxyisobutyrate dehydrogenase-like beta-hydroxyacid dehydrogenase